MNRRSFFKSLLLGVMTPIALRFGAFNVEVVAPVIEDNTSMVLLQWSDVEVYVDGIKLTLSNEYEISEGWHNYQVTATKAPEKGEIITVERKVL